MKYSATDKDTNPKGVEADMIEYATEETGRIIEKKILPEYFCGVVSCKKMFELRKDDDGIKPGDTLVLREWDGKSYTGGIAKRKVASVLKDCPEYGLMDGYCILSLQIAE